MAKRFIFFFPEDVSIFALGTLWNSSSYQSAFAALFYSLGILGVVLQGRCFLCPFTQHPMGLQLSASLRNLKIILELF